VPHLQYQLQRDWLLPAQVACPFRVAVLLAGLVERVVSRPFGVSRAPRPHAARSNVVAMIATAEIAVAVLIPSTVATMVCPSGNLLVPIV
jgi:hypothetical protein